ncbi:RNA polymerase sigma-70 factor (ECF subfamily) [Brevundimonas nasdae]|uniref:RNA polymerase sigma factor n=1 Tax=Brevundimonas nasdae TaxID=172043 RepID=UPI001912BA36|nr:sigma-70 family RNA polymerase sigma factor [Brevundimonas nasdae]MBK6025786.1 sigma-70 family RNA polymerase sigma factor [Brevundimonas nasdae]MDQ0452364.1 RNA polymerase sigma-70 factor (ECF subfamily) [Brevundimonas nasdae]
MAEKAEPAPSSSVDELYRRYAAWLRARLGARFGAHAADDLVQEAYLRIRPYQARGIRSPKSLLLRIASNLALDGLAREAVRQKHLNDASAGSDAAFDSPHETLLLKQIVRSIPEKDREVFLLSRFGGLTHAQIAARLGIAVKTVEWRMARALKHCDDHLRR